MSQAHSLFAYSSGGKAVTMNVFRGVSPVFSPSLPSFSSYSFFHPFPFSLCFPFLSLRFAGSLKSSYPEEHCRWKVPLQVPGKVLVANTFCSIRNASVSCKCHSVSIEQNLKIEILRDIFLILFWGCFSTQNERRRVRQSAQGSADD